MVITIPLTDFFRCPSSRTTYKLCAFFSQIDILNSLWSCQSYFRWYDQFSVSNYSATHFFSNFTVRFTHSHWYGYLELRRLSDDNPFLFGALSEMVVDEWQIDWWGRYNIVIIFIERNRSFVIISAMPFDIACEN